jgi:molybdopterin synthase catalytic subunit
MIRLTSEEIDTHSLLESVRSNQSGAVVLFLGTVREMTDGQQTVALDYDAYPEMAEAKMAELEQEAREKWPIDQLAIVHRLGHLELGDVSVAIALSCPHRNQAFEAGRFLIDELKIRVPIWKKENWADGSTEWVHPGTGESVDVQNRKNKDHSAIPDQNQ